MRKIILVLACLLSANICFGQARSSQRFVVDEVVNYNDIKIGYTRHFCANDDPSANIWKLNNTLTVEYNRYLWGGLQMGLYAGARTYGVHNYSENVNVPVEEGIAILYGLNINYHFRGFFNENITSWDAWAGARVGGYTANATSYEYAGLIGGSYYITPHIGLFAEILYGNSFLYEFQQQANGLHPQLRAGVTFQF